MEPAGPEGKKSSRRACQTRKRRGVVGQVSARVLAGGGKSTSVRVGPI